MKMFGQREFFIALGFAGVSAFAHLVWNPIAVYWQFIVTMVLFVSGLSIWLRNEWRRLESFVTRLYCSAVIFDIFAEGLLQPFHKCTRDNLICTGQMFLVFLAFWVVLRPAEQWLPYAKRRRVTNALR
jgi:hypothetical protein